MKPSGPLLLARYLALAWGGLLIYGSLHPFSGWRDTGISPFAFLEGGWPRYWTFFDLALNVAAYLPLGFFLTLALFRLPGRFTAPLLATLAGTALSFGLESVQTWLPARVPSHLDLACNSLGTLLGAVTAQYAGRRFFPRLARWQRRLFGAAPHAEMGLTLLGLWLLVPLSPEILLFGAGDLRQMLELPGAVPFSADSFRRLESAVIALNTLAVGLLVRQLSRSSRLAYAVVPAFLLLALGMRAFGAVVLTGPENALSWLTPGAASGLLAGVGLLALCLVLPPVPRLTLAALALMAATALVNLAPPNPYSQAALAAWQQGHFLNFNGLTRLVSVVWPFLALPFFLLSARTERP